MTNGKAFEEGSRVEFLDTRYNRDQGIVGLRGRVFIRGMRLQEKTIFAVEREDWPGKLEYVHKGEVKELSDGS